MKLDWKEILEAFREGLFYNYDFGLSLGLIVGGCQEPVGQAITDEKLAIEETKQIFVEMKDYNENNFIVQTTSCDGLNRTIFCFVDSIKNENSINVDFDFLWDEYGEDIIAGNFNINDSDRKILNQLYENKNQQ